MQDDFTTVEAVLDPKAVATGLADQHVADIAEILNEQSTEVAAEILLHLPMDQAVEVLDQPELEASAELIAALPDDRAAIFLSGMSADRAADVFRELEEPRRSALLKRLDHETRLSLQRLLAYPPDTGQHHDDRVRQRPGNLEGRANARSHPPRRA